MPNRKTGRKVRGSSRTTASGARRTRRARGKAARATYTVAGTGGRGR